MPYRRNRTHYIKPRYPPGAEKLYMSSTMTKAGAAATARAAGTSWAGYLSGINRGIDLARAANTTYFKARDFYRDAKYAGQSKARAAGGTVGGNSTRQSTANIHTGGFTKYGMNYSKNMKTKGKKGWKGKLIVPYNKKKTRQYKKKLPHQIMQRYFLTPPGNLDANGVLSFPQDMFTSNPSLDAKHMSSVVLKLSVCENHLNPHNYNIGKQLVPYSMGEYVGANTIVWENNSTNTALQTVQIPYQVNKFPVSGYASRWMKPTGTDADVAFEMPSSVITGVNLNLVFKSGGQPFDQTLCVKVVRCNLPVAFRSGEWASADGVVPAEVIQRELCNRGNFTSRLAFDTIWTKSIKLRGVKGGNQKIPTVRLKKFLKMQYLRSTIRRVSTAGDQATIGSQALPNTYESQDGYFNNLYVVVSSKCVDDQYVATVTRDLASAGLPGLDDQNTREELGTLASIPPAQLNAAGVAVNKLTCFFRYGGQFSVYRRVKEADTGITGGLNQTASNVQSLQDQIHELQALIGDGGNSDCTTCDDNEVVESSDDDDEDCGSGHDAGSTPSDTHTHPNDMTAEEHAAECQHSH